jgi:hypothetical protein
LSFARFLDTAAWTTERGSCHAGHIPSFATLAALKSLVPGGNDLPPADVEWLAMDEGVRHRKVSMLKNSSEGGA